MAQISIPSENVELKRFSFLREKARALASQSKFYEASSLLERVDDNATVQNLGTKLLMADCYLQLGRENRASKCLRHIERTLKSKPELHPDDLVQMADDFITGALHVRAMIILNIAADVYLASSQTPDEILSGVYRCYNKFDDIVTLMLKHGGRNRTIAADMGMESMHEIYEKICEIKNCNRDHQVLKEALCCRWLDYNYHLLEQKEKCIKHATRGIETMEKHFTPEGAQRHHIYGSLLHNLAITVQGMEKWNEALQIFQKALVAKEIADDHSDESSRKNDIDETRKKIKKLKAKMGQL